MSLETRGYNTSGQNKRRWPYLLLIITLLFIFVVLIVSWSKGVFIVNRKVDGDMKLRNGEQIVEHDTTFKFLGKKIASAGFSPDDPSIITCPLEINYRDNYETTDLAEGESIKVHGFNILMKKCEGEVNRVSHVTFSLNDTVDPILRDGGSYCEFSSECNSLSCGEDIYPDCTANRCVCGD